jgi:hypothetical protein
LIFSSIAFAYFKSDFAALACDWALLAREREEGARSSCRDDRLRVLVWKWMRGAGDAELRTEYED